MLKSLPILTAPTPEELMLLYIVTTTQVVSAALVVEREEPRRSPKVQHPVYFVSEVLSNSKTRYYFDAHPSPWCPSTRSWRSSRTPRPKEG
jgi:hypothetical protein